ncbi:MAG TPA: outer membrane beta-barrel protein [Bacteroidota bacterium]
MRRSLLIVLLCVYLVSPAHSQLRFGGGVQGGLAFASFVPALKDFYGSGFGFGAHADLGLASFLTLRLNGDWHTFPSDKTKLARAFAAEFTVGGAPADPNLTSFSGWNINIISVTANAIGKLSTESAVVPYGMAGLGIVALSASDPSLAYQGIGDITATLTQQGVVGKLDSETAFTTNFGLGLEFPLGAVRPFIEARYVLFFPKGGSNSAFMPVTVGVTF